jgi:hypothetical protein
LKQNYKPSETQNNNISGDKVNKWKEVFHNSLEMINY